LELRDLLTAYKFPGDKTPIVRGSALKALNSTSKDPNAEEYKCILELMRVVDEYIPTPKRAVDKPFLMPIEDVFGIKGRGTVVTGPRWIAEWSRWVTRSKSSGCGKRARRW